MQQRIIQILNVPLQKLSQSQVMQVEVVVVVRVKVAVVWYIVEIVVVVIVAVVGSQHLLWSFMCNEFFPSRT